MLAFMLFVSNKSCTNSTVPLIQQSMSSVKIPFLNANVGAKADTNFFQMIKNRLCPNFQFISLTTALIGACLIIFIVTRVMFSPGGYSQFLQHPRQMDKWALDVQLIKSNRAYFYETVTAMFIHFSYKHLAGNLIFAFFIMYEIQSCWRWGLVVGLVAGFAANAMAIATMEGMLMGFSGVLCACVGIELAALILHCSFLQERYGPQFYMMFFFLILMIFMIIGITNAALVHLFGLLYGMLFGLTFYPRMPEVNINANVDKLFKIFSALFLGLAILLGLVV